MNTQQHRAYIASPAWQTRRARYFRGHPRRCTACGSARDIQLHHLTYENAGRGYEPDDDLMPLCDRHHELAHEFEQSGRFGPWGITGTLRSATRAMVDQVRGGTPTKPPHPRRRSWWRRQWLLLTGRRFTDAWEELG